jgi:hypothetical protein
MSLRALSFWLSYTRLIRGLLLRRQLDDLRAGYVVLFQLLGQDGRLVRSTGWCLVYGRRDPSSFTR